MPYLLPSEYASFGLAPDTPDDLVASASALIEAHCRRPTLLAAQYTERIRLAAGSQTGRLSYGPLLPGAIVSARVRYARGRRGDATDLSTQQLLGLEIATAFGLPGNWSTLDPASIDLYAEAREVTFRPMFLGLGFNEAEITYTAGFVTVPAQIKSACAQIVRNAQSTPALNVKYSRLDTMQMEYFAPTLLDSDVQTLLRPFVAGRLS